MIHHIERRLIFKPNKLDHGGLTNIPFERFRFGHEFGFNLDGVFYEGSSHTAVLFLHGNRHNITKFSDHYKLFTALGVSFMAFDYPGYGTSEGSPSEEALYASARAAFAHITAARGFAPHRTFVYGCSLGGAVASELVGNTSVAGLFIESTFTNSHDMGKHLYPYFPLWLITPKRFQNDERFAGLSVPVMIIHGDQDRVVPVSMAHTLYEKVTGPKQLAIVPGANHVNSIAMGDAALRAEIERFIATHLPS